MAPTWADTTESRSGLSVTASMGIQANSYVTRYGLRLLPDLYEAFNPLTYKAAQEREVEIGIDLRSAGFGVWQA